MTKAPSPSAPITPLDWIRLTATALRERGVDPGQRVHYTGHEQPLAGPWIGCIGKWGVSERHQLINTDFPNHGLLPVGHEAFRSFKKRNKLLYGSQFRALHGDLPWMPAEVCYGYYRDEQGAFYRANRTWASLGIACKAAVELGAHPNSPYTNRVGMLPVEMVLWTRVFADFLWQHELAYPEWEDFSDEIKAEYWALGFGSDHEPWSTELFLRRPAICNLQDCYPILDQLGFSSTPRGGSTTGPQAPLPL